MLTCAALCLRLTPELVAECERVVSKTFPACVAFHKPSFVQQLKNTSLESTLVYGLLTCAARYVSIFYLSSFFTSLVSRRCDAHRWFASYPRSLNQPWTRSPPNLNLGGRFARRALEIGPVPTRLHLAGCLSAVWLQPILTVANGGIYSAWPS